MVAKLCKRKFYKFRRCQKIVRLSLPYLTFAARWVRTDIAPNSGAAVLEVDIPTGYHVKWAVLQDHRLDGAVRVMLSKFAYQKVIMGIEFVSTGRSCLSVWHVSGTTTILLLKLYLFISD